MKNIELLNQNPKAHWEAVNKLLNGISGHHKQATVVNMKDPITGKTAKTSQENEKIFATHLEHNVFICRLESAYNSSVLIKTTQQPENSELSIPPPPKEIFEAIYKMLNDKSPGRNGITPKAYKLWISGETREILVSIIHKYWTDDTFFQIYFTR